MDIARITPDYAVAPQISPQDAESIRAAGFTDVICNRPDEEVGGELASDAMRSAIEAAGLRFHFNPVQSGAMTETNVTAQSETLAHAEGPVLAYCRSGTRCSVVWAFGRDDLEIDDILEATSRAGYRLDELRPQLERRRG